MDIIQPGGCLDFTGGLQAKDKCFGMLCSEVSFETACVHVGFGFYFIGNL